MKKLCFAALALIALLATSCKSNKDFIYLADMYEGTAMPLTQTHEVKVMPGDRLRITVTSRNPELAMPFNQGLGVMSESEAVAAAQSGRSRSNLSEPYKVDNDGYIKFPILGKLKVEGLTTTEVGDLIRQRIIAGDYIKDPIVNVDLVNFTYTVLGAIGNNGTFRPQTDKVTILEAIANAGDLSSKADMGKIAVIREENGHRKMYTMDIRKSDIFNSPAYYLQQNDIVYVTPKFGKKDTEDRTLQWITLALSVLTAATSITWAIRK